MRLEDRLSQYKSILKANHNHSEALRLSLDQLGRQASDYDRIFLHAFAPVLTGYVIWVLRQARADKVKRLYFLARDGWLMYEMAQIIAKKEKLDIDLRYIHVSRYVLRNAEYHFIGRQCIDSVCVGGIDVTFEKLMKRAALTDEEIRIVAAEVGFSDRLSECLSYAQVQELRVKLDALGTSFIELVNKHSKGFYEAVSQYFEYVGLTDDVSYAIVDSGWLGTTARSMGNILAFMTGKGYSIKGYYFGIYELPAGVNRTCFKPYYLRPNRDIGRKCRFSICLFETLFSSYEGMTMGYISSQNKVEPILSEAGNPNREKMLRNKELLMIYADFLKTGDLSLKVAEKLLSLIMGYPTRAEAEIFGALQFCDDVLELQLQNVAAVWDMKELKHQRFFKRISIKFFKSKEMLHESGWPEASIVNLVGDGLAGRWALFNERLYKRGMYVRKAIR